MDPSSVWGHMYTTDFFNKIKDDTDESVEPFKHIQSKTNNYGYYLFQEKSFDKSECHDGPDRYGHCVFMIDKNNEKTFKVRYSDYPW